MIFRNSLNVKRGLKMLFILLGILLLVEIVSLLWLAGSVNRYSAFWEAKAKANGEITYLALGDSAAQGIGATSPMKGYVGLVANNIEKKTGKTVRIVNISKTGATMNDYLEQQAPRIKHIKPDIITIEIGANNVSKFNEQEYRGQFKKVVNTLPDNSYVANMPLFNSRPGSTENGKQASRIIEEELRQNPILNFVDLQTKTQQNQSIFGFAPDLFHPNNLSYKNWANAFIEEINKAKSL